MAFALIFFFFNFSLIRSDHYFLENGKSKELEFKPNSLHHQIDNFQKQSFQNVKMWTKLEEYNVLYL